MKLSEGAARPGQSGPTRAFAERFLRLPDSSGRLGPMRFHPAQRRFLDAWDERKPDGTRRYRQGFVSWPKQAFKTTTAQIVLAADLFSGRGPDREYALVSTGATQAGDVGFAGLVRFVERAPGLSKVSKIYANELVYEERVREPSTGGTYTQAHRVTALPSQRAADWHHGRALTGAWVDECWGLGERGYAVLEAVMPSPTRDSWLLVTSYAGLRQHAKPGYLLWDLWTRAQQSDPTLLASILQGYDAYQGIPHVTPAFLADQAALLQHVPGRRDRLWKNLWTTSDEGALLTALEVAAAVDDTLPLPAVPLPGVRYALGVDLGYSHDWAAGVVTHVSGEGRLVVDLVEFWQGTPQTPVDFGHVERWIVETAERFRLCGIWGDQWQFLGMKANLAHRLRRVPITAVTVESARLDHYAIFLKQLFSGRLVKIPREPIELHEQLESVVAVESTARDRLKLQSGSGGGARSFDDIVIALLLSTEGHQHLRTKGGRVTGTSDIGRPHMAQIDHCVAARVLGVQDYTISCPIADTTMPSALPGCLRCEAYVSVQRVRDTHLADTGEWLEIPTVAATRVQPCRWVRDRRFRRVAEWVQ